MSYYDPWTHAIQLFFIRLAQFIIASLMFGTLAWFSLLHLLEVDLLKATRVALEGSMLDLRIMLILCAIIGAILTGWLFMWLMMRWPARNRGADRHHRGARVIVRDDE